MFTRVPYAPWAHPALGPALTFTFSAHSRKLMRMQSSENGIVMWRTNIIFEENIILTFQQALIGS